MEIFITEREQAAAENSAETVDALAVVIVIFGFAFVPDVDSEYFHLAADTEHFLQRIVGLFHVVQFHSEIDFI